jgi:polysaccharide export outer membrane protein
MQKISRPWLIGGSVLAMSFVSAHAAPAPAPAVKPAQAAPASSGEAGNPSMGSAEGASQTYILGPADVIEVSVLGRQDFDVRGRIGEDGTLRVPYLGAVKAADKTTGQLEDELTKALETGGYFTHPIVKVDIVSYGSRYVTALGQVVTPGLIPVDRPYRLSEIIARVGGLKEGGAPYVIFTPAHGQQRHILIKDLATGDLKDDPFVSPGDKIYAPEAELFYVSGQVKQPGAFGLLPDITFRMALSRAGGVTDSGSDKNFTVTRAGKKMTHVDLDAKVMAGDVIVVPERLF